MNKRLEVWWEGSAKGVAEQCLNHIDERISALFDYYENVEQSIKQDHQLVQDFYGDARSIDRHIKRDVKQPFLKIREKFFVICLRDYVFDLAFKMGQFSNINQIVEQLIDEYKEIRQDLLDLQKRFAEKDDTLDLKVIEEMTELIGDIHELDKKCVWVVETRMGLEEERDLILDEMEGFICKNTQKLKEAEEEADM